MKISRLLVPAVGGTLLATASSTQAAVCFYQAGVMLEEIRSNVGGANPPGSWDIDNTDMVGAPYDLIPDDPNVSITTQTNLAYSQSSPPWTNPINGTTDNITVKYEFDYYDDDGIFSFAENIDDQAVVIVNGTTVVNNNSWNTATYGVYNNPATAGTWHTVEIYMREGGGGAGPGGANNNGATNWTNGANGFGLGFYDGDYGLVDALSPATLNDPNAADFVAVGAANMTIRAKLIVVPEPARAVLLIAGAACVTLRRRRRLST